MVWAGATNSSATRATAGAGRSAVETGDALFLNPATLVHLRGRGIYSQATSDSFSVGLTENAKDSFLPAGFSYSQQKWGHPFAPQEERFQNLRLSFADFVTSNLAFGLAGNQKTLTILEKTYTQINGDAGFLWTPTPGTGLALVVSDAFPTAQDYPEEFRSNALYSVGATFIDREVSRYRVDYMRGGTKSWEQGALALGFEAYTTQFTVFRMGARREQKTERTLFSTGFGLTLPRFQIHYAYMDHETFEDPQRHSVDLSIPF